MRPPRICLLALAAVACKEAAPSPGAPDPGVVIAGSVSMQPLVEKWAAAFNAQHPDARLVVQGGGSTAGVRAVVMGKAQVAMLSRPLAADETGVSAVPVAHDALALVVHPGNPVGEVSIDQAHGLLDGKIPTWKPLGGPDLSVLVVAREPGAGARGLVEDVLTGQDAPPDGAKLVTTSAAVRAAVAADPGAVGYLPLPLCDPTVKPLRLAGIAPS